MTRHGRLLTLLSGRGGLAYALLRDLFSTDVDPLVDGAAVPGAGTRDATGSFWKALASALRGGGQTGTPAWGSSKLVYDGVTRASGRTLMALVIPEDTIATNQAFAFGWDTATGTTDPRTVGHQFVSELGTLAAAAAGQKAVIAATRTLRPAQYLVGVTLSDAGAVVWISAVAADTGSFAGSTDPIGIPAYPSARIVWATPNGADATLYPSIQALGTLSYPDGNCFQDVRIVDMVEPTYTGDTFTRADSASSLGGSWTAEAGTWGISSNAAYAPSLSGLSRAYLPSLLTGGDGLVMCDITMPSNLAAGCGLIVRRQDASNYIRIWTNGTTQIAIQTFVSGAFGATIASTAVSWTTGRVYRWYVFMKGNQYRFFYEDTTTGTITDAFSAWQTDSNNRFLTAEGVGLYALNGTGYTSIRWDNLRVYPHTYTLSGVTGATPVQRTTGATLATDSFTDTNGTRLNAHTAEAGGAWTEQAGTWSISSNAVALSAAAGSNYATQNLASTNARASITITTPGTFSAGKLRAGIVGRYTDANTLVAARLYMDDALQLNNDEVELLEGNGSSVSIVHKVNIGNLFATSTAYTLALEIAADPNGGADLAHVYLGGVNVLSYKLSTTQTGTRWGLYDDSSGDRCTFDTWSVVGVS